jgi:hypothetical protein
MAEPVVPVWPRPYFKASEQPTKLLFVCFGQAPLAEVEIVGARFGVPSRELALSVDMREHRRADKAAWFESWWAGAFGVIAERDLEADLPLLTTSNVCFTLKYDGPDQSDLGRLQTVWGLSRWLCARGASVVLDLHAMRYRTRADVEELDFSGADVQRDVKIVLESEPSRDGLHLLHTRGLCKVGRPELLCFVEPEDAATLGRYVNQIARTLLEGATAPQIRLKVADGVELVALPSSEPALVGSLGLESGVMLARSDGAPLVGIRRLLGEA